MTQRKWRIGPKKRWRIPIWGEKFWKFIPQPRFLRRWYYKKSFQWWGHPSNHHWKGWIVGCGDYFGNIKHLKIGERDLWSGEYKTGIDESATANKEYEQKN